MPTVDDYDALLPNEHRGQPNLTATINVGVQPFVDEQGQLDALSPLYDLDVAVGVQLDAVGVRVGRNRYVNVPLADAYFSWDTAGLGWDQGYWQGQFDPTQGVVALDDATYRVLLRAVIIANSWNGTIAGAAPALAELFNGTLTPGTQLFIYDNFDMTMTVGIVGTTPPAIILGILGEGEVPLKPVGVLVNYVMSSVSGTPIFGYDIENDFVSGWDVGSWSVPIPF